jgi:hypothetical protein
MIIGERAFLMSAPLLDIERLTSDYELSGLAAFLANHFEAKHEGALLVREGRCPS